MLFVLRLLPPFKKWQQKVVYITFILNVIITLIATVSYGVSCIPFRAGWENVPNAKCVSKNVLVATQKVNGGMRLHRFPLYKRPNISQYPRSGLCD